MHDYSMLLIRQIFSKKHMAYDVKIKQVLLSLVEVCEYRTNNFTLADVSGQFQ